MSSGPRRLECLEEERDLGRVVLAVGVERDDGHGAVLQGVAEAGAQCRALARIRDLAQDDGPGRLGLRRRVVGRAVVDDDDGQEGPRTLDHGRDARALLVARDERKDRRPHGNPTRCRRFGVKDDGDRARRWRLEADRGDDLVELGEVRRGRARQVHGVDHLSRAVDVDDVDGVVLSVAVRPRGGAELGVRARRPPTEDRKCALEIAGRYVDVVRNRQLDLLARVTAHGHGCRRARHRGRPARAARSRGHRPSVRRVE